MPRTRVPHGRRTPGTRPRGRRVRGQRRLRRRIRFSHHRRPRVRLYVPGGRQRHGTSQHKDHCGAQGHHRGGDPRRTARPRPPAPRRPDGTTRTRSSARQRRTQRPRSHGTARSLQSHRGHGTPRSPGTPTSPGIRRSRTTAHRTRPGNHNPQPRQQLIRRRPITRLPSQTAPHQRPQPIWHPTHIRRAIHQPVHEQRIRPHPERPLSASRVHQHRTQAEDVARRPDVLPQGLLRRREPGRAQPGRAQPGRAQPGQRKPGHLRTVRGQQHLRRAEIPMHQPRIMNGPQALRQPERQPRQNVRRHRPPVTHRLSQRGPGHVRRSHPGHVSVQVRGDHRHRERPVHPPGRRHFGPEHRIGGHLGPDGPHRGPVPVRRQAHEQPIAARRLNQPVRPDRRKRNYHPKSPLSGADTPVQGYFRS